MNKNYRLIYKNNIRTSLNQKLSMLNESKDFPRIKIQ